MDLFSLMAQNIQAGFAVALTPDNLLYCFIGCLVGTAVGVLPGIGPLAALSLLLPLTFNVPPVSSIIMLTGIFYGSMYGGSTTSILVNIPGEVASVVTCLDGYQMARKGRAGAALSMAAFGSFIAGTIGNVGVSFFSPVLVKAALQFGPPEYFAIMTLAFVICLFMIGGSIFKGLIMIFLGIFFSAIGLDHVRGVERFTFGSMYLRGGFDLVPVLMGMFGISEVLHNIVTAYKQDTFISKITKIYPTLQDWVDSCKPILRGSLLGFAIGIIPGGSPHKAAFLSYAIEKRIHPHPEKFGTGLIEGVAGPESANNSAVASAMIPLLSLGIPGNAVTALLLGALIIHGVQPGPMLMTQHPDIFWGVIASMYIGNVMLLILNLPLISIWVQFLKIPIQILFPLIFIMCVTGCYSANNNMFDVWAGIGFGVFGFILRQRGYELAPFALAIVLGSLMEQALRQSLVMSVGSPVIFFTRPICIVILAATALILGLFIRGEIKNTEGGVSEGAN